VGVFTAASPSFNVGPIPAASLQTLADALTALTASWTAYTPTGTASAGSWTRVNGVLSGRYRQIGKTVDFSIQYTVGSSDTLGTAGAYWIIGLPPVGNTVAPYVFPLRMLDAATLEYTGFASCGSGVAVVELFKPVSGRIFNNSPFTFGTGDLFWLNGTYEIA
jgi:hypothetical protein